MVDEAFFRIYLTEKDADIHKLPVEGVTDVVLEIGDIMLEKMDVCFISNGIYGAIDALFGPGDSEYVAYDKCKILVKKIEELDEQDVELKEWLKKLIEIANDAIKNESGLYFDL